MKRLFVILLCVYQMQSFTLIAQKIHFTDSTNVWNHLLISYATLPTAYLYDNYYFLADTTIDSQRYRWANFDIGTGTGSFVREDTILKKVYIRQSHADTTRDTDIVLMDYNLAVGDTFVVEYYDTFNHYRYRVSSIDSTLINSIWHKVWHFSFILSGGVIAHYCDVIEGIGCTEHPVYMLYGHGVMGENLDYVYCFSTHGSSPPVSPPVSFFDNTSSCISYPALLSLKTVKSELPSRIYPNPAQSIVTVESAGKVNKIEIINIWGQKVSGFQWNAVDAAIDVSGLPSGNYFIRVNGTEVRKFIKQ
jgi:hypothetical protein